MKCKNLYSSLLYCSVNDFAKNAQVSIVNNKITDVTCDFERLDKNKTLYRDNLKIYFNNIQYETIKKYPNYYIIGMASGYNIDNFKDIFVIKINLRSAIISDSDLLMLKFNMLQY